MTDYSADNFSSPNGPGPFPPQRAADESATPPAGTNLVGFGTGSSAAPDGPGTGNDDPAGSAPSAGTGPGAAASDSSGPRGEGPPNVGPGGATNGFVPGSGTGAGSGSGTAPLGPSGIGGSGSGSSGIGPSGLGGGSGATGLGNSGGIANGGGIGATGGSGIGPGPGSGSPSSIGGPSSLGGSSANLGGGAPNSGIGSTGPSGAGIPSAPSAPPAAGGPSPSPFGRPSGAPAAGDQPNGGQQRPPGPSDVKGRIEVADEVVEKVAALAAMEVPGVADLGGDIARALENVRERIGIGQKRGDQGIKARVTNREVTVDVTIVIEYGHVVMDVARQVKHNVASQTSRMLGLRVVEVNVTVDDVKLPEPPKTEDDSGDLLPIE